MKTITPDAGLAMVAAELAEKGSWPVGGGWMDQTQICVQAVRLVWAEESHWKAAKGV